MTETKEQSQSPMTLTQGRLIQAQGQEVSSKIDLLLPLLSLLEREGKEAPEGDPVEQIVGLLQQIVENQTRHDQVLLDIQQKLDSICQIIAAD